MAKRQCDPTSGSIGLHTYLQGRNGQVVRFRAVPVNPRSAPQIAARARMTTVSQGWRALTEEQREAWRAAAVGVNSRPRLAQYGALTGEQLYCRINLSLTSIGGDAVDAPPAYPEFTAVPVSSLEITNTGGTIALKLVTTGTPADGATLRGAGPVSTGIQRPPRLAVLGTLDAPAANRITVTTLYVARYGVPGVGKRVFVSVNNNIDGWEDLPVWFSAEVPTTT